MVDSPQWMIVPGNAALSALVLFVIAMPFLYAARKPVHDLVHALGHLVGVPLKLVALWLQAAAREMRERNRQAQRVRIGNKQRLNEIHSGADVGPVVAVLDGEAAHPPGLIDVEVNVLPAVACRSCRGLGFLIVLHLFDHETEAFEVA